MATVYITSPHSYPHAHFDTLCRGRSLNPDRVLAGFMRVRVRYPAAQQTMVSLTASPDKTKFEHHVLGDHPSEADRVVESGLRLLHIERNPIWRRYTQY